MGVISILLRFQCNCDSYIVTRSELEPGDHIYTERAGYVYFHHGIYVGEDMVIHFLPDPKKKGILSSSAASSSLQGSGRCPKCGHSPDRDGGIVKTCLDCFLDGNSIRVFRHGVTHMPLRYCSRKNSKPPDQVVECAIHLFEQNGFGEYRLVVNNCEHFASLCKTGIRSCSQGVYWIHNVLL
ncbi:hypothetical protein JRO89_XS04G0161000 [Xanthoceras sorbifolium]|uniref:LRAT domain-containing protein n=1 Tax=Xanthoceras sorbifolium TaxID=99658 RepID=A0ABQ8I5H2_9ROSI|nr:hypothetical protein JRO89_XS04G0161000 [Xanthoceras sorbifolium]